MAQPLLSLFSARKNNNNKNFKSIWTKIRWKQALDSIQNSSGKPNPNRQAKDNWEIELPDKGQLGSQITGQKF